MAADVSGSLSTPRRELLRWVGRVLGAGLLPLACAPAAPPDGRTRVPLTAVPPGERVRAMMGEDPVELVREASTVRARSLLCTHFGCEVRWNSAQGAYLCPCHEGRFDAHGRPIAGPPPRPLREVPVTVEGDWIILGAPPAG